MIKLGECTHLDAARLARNARCVILLPLGAVEEHGPHLPLLVDWLGAEELARRIAPRLERAGLTPILAPSLPYGVSTLAAEWPGTVSLSRALVTRLIVEVIRALARHGFRSFVLVNYQADPDHLAAMHAARRALARGRKLRVVFAGFAPDSAANAAMVNPRVLRLLRSPRPESEWHSGELETAMQAAMEDVHVAEVIERYVVDLVRATRSDHRLALGASPRGALALLKLSRALAALRRRDFVLPDDVKTMAVPALAHRLILKPELWAARVSATQVVENLLTAVAAPGPDAR